MKKNIVFWPLIFVGSFFVLLGYPLTSKAVAEETSAHWSYEGESGPEHWGDLDTKYSACLEGKNQSPVNLTAMIESDLSPIDINYQAGGKEVVNNGHTIQVNYESGSTITVDDHEFELKQFHFHSPSENMIEDESFPVEAHFVHADQDGNLAVIAVMFEAGEENAELEKVWAKMPSDEDESSTLSESVNADTILPSDRGYHRFNGSLTTPPCSEGVWWLVMQNTSNISQEQIDKFSSAVHIPNNRPVQPLNARPVLQ